MTDDNRGLVLALRCPALARLPLFLALTAVGCSSSSNGSGGGGASGTGGVAAGYGR